MTLQNSGGAVEAPLVRFGDVTITEHWLVTPQGTRPLAGTQIFVTDMSRVERVVPTWAIVLTIVGFFFIFLLSLLFLLVKEDRVSGFAQITVTNGPLTHQTAEPMGPNPSATLWELQNRANYARGLVERAS